MRWFGAALLFCTGSGIVIRVTGSGTLAQRVTEPAPPCPRSAYHAKMTHVFNLIQHDCNLIEGGNLNEEFIPLYIGSKAVPYMEFPFT